MPHTILRTVLAAALLSTSVIAGCAAVAEYNEVTAERIARPAFMVERKMAFDGMDMQLWERMHQRGESANVYIEGDGGDEKILSGYDPTPDNPVALHLASRDLAKNVAYIGRPCQFRESQDKKECHQKFFGTRRFSPEVLASYNAILDDIKKRYGITSLNLIGYDGGANIAALLASSREDVVSLRTVAGKLTKSAYATEKTAMEPDNLMADVIAPSLANKPQHHFIGAGDAIVPPAIYHSFRQSMGASECVNYTLVQDADHTRGWVEKWPELLKATVACPPPIEPVELPPAPAGIIDLSNGQK